MPITKYQTELGNLGSGQAANQRRRWYVWCNIEAYRYNF